MENSVPKIFVSYTIRDGIIDVEFLLNVERSMKGLGKLFIDLIHNDSLDKQVRVLNELVNSDIFVLLKTKETLNSEWVKKEVSIADEIEIPILEFEYELLIKENFYPIKKAISYTPIMLCSSPDQTIESKNARNT